MNEEWEPTPIQKAVIFWVVMIFLVGVGAICLYALGKWVMG